MRSEFDDPRQDAVSKAITVAQVHRRRGELEAAWRAIDDALAMAPEWPPLLELMGELNLDEGNLEAAVQCFRRALDAEPGRASAEVGLGRALLAAQPATGESGPDPLLARRKPATAAVLSALVPGLGQAYANDLSRGVTFFLVTMLGWFVVANQYLVAMDRAGRGRARSLLDLGGELGGLFWVASLLLLAWTVAAAVDAWVQLARAQAAGQPTA